MIHISSLAEFCYFDFDNLHWTNKFEFNNRLSLGKKYVTKTYLKYLALDLGTLNVPFSLRDHNQYRAHVLCRQTILKGPNLIRGSKFFRICHLTLFGMESEGKKNAHL